MTNKEQDFCHYLKTDEAFELVGKYGIPAIKGVRMKKLKAPDLLGFNYATAYSTPQRKNKTVHFFLADMAFERVWNKPIVYTSMLSQFKACISPDFSVYWDMPKAMRIWQYYRKMWLSAYWQQHGMTVIPSIRWGFKHEDDDVCFEGLPKNSCIALSTVGQVQDKDNKLNFEKGFDHMLEVLEPAQMIIYGRPLKCIENCGVPFVRVESEMYKRIHHDEEV